MGKRVHGLALLAAIETNDHKKVQHIVNVQIHNAAKTREILVSDISRLPGGPTVCPLLIAVSLPDPSIIKYLNIHQGVDINFVHKEPNSKGIKLTTPLIQAIKCKLYSTVELLLSLNADTSKQDHRGRTALHHAVYRSDFRMAKMLLARGAPVDISDVKGNAPLHVATLYGHCELVRLLITHGADLYRKGEYGALPIHIAAKEGHVHLLRLFNSLDININLMVPCFEDSRELAPLHVAAEQGHYEAALVMLEQFGAEVNIADSEGETPLHCIVLNEYDPYGMKSKDDFTDTAKVLIRCSADVNMKNYRGETPLHHAARNEFQKLIELLIVAGADPLVVDNDGNRPLDLVSSDDKASQHTLKKAMQDREAIISELMEIHGRGFTASLRSLTDGGSGGSKRSSILSGSSLGVPLGRSSSSVFDDDFLKELGSKNRVNMPDQLSILGIQPRSGALRRQGSSTSFNSASSDPFGGKILNGNTSFTSETASEPVQSVIAPKAVRRTSSSIRNSSENHIDASPSSKRLSNSSVEKIMARITSTSSVTRVPTTTMNAADSDTESGLDADTKSTSTIKDDDDDGSQGTLEEWDDVDSVMQEETEPEKHRNPVVIPLVPKVAAPPVAQTKPAVNNDRQPNNRYSAHSSGQSDSDDTFLDDSFDTEFSDNDQSQATYMNVPVNAGDISGNNTLSRKEQALLLEQTPELKNWLKEQATIMDKVAQVTQLQHGAKIHNKPAGSESPQTPTTPKKAVEPPIPARRSNSSSSIQRPTRRPPPPPCAHKMDAVIDTLIDRQQSFENSTNETTPVPKPRTKSRTSTEELDSNVSESFSASEFNDLSLEGDSMTWDDSTACVVSNSVLKQQTPDSMPRLASEEDLSQVSQSSDTSSSDSVPNSGHQIASMFDPVVQRKMQYVVPLERKRPSSSVSNHSDLSDHLTQSVSDSIVNEYDFMAKIGAVQAADASSIEEQVNLTLAAADMSSDTLLDSEYERSDSSKQTTPQVQKKTTPPKLKMNEQYLMDYEDVPEKPKRKVTIGQNQVFQDPPRTPKDHDHRMISFYHDGKNNISVIGGNAEGIFIHRIQPGSTPELAGLMEGDQILKINGRNIKGKTKEEVMLILLSLPREVTFVVRLKRDRYEGIMENGGMGDSLFVKANFNYDATQDGEISFSNGDILSVRDTMPDGKVGYWRALKVYATPEEDQHGLVPNDSRGEQIALAQKRAREMSLENDKRGGFFRRSLRKSRSSQSINKVGRSVKRSKSVDRIAADNISITSIAAGTLKAYERVEQRPPGLVRPVVLMGVFCEAVRNKLIMESPGRFEKPDGIIHIPEDVQDTGTNKDVNLGPVQNVINRKRHCLMLASPRAVQFIRAANMHPIVIYLSPGNKSLVKHMRSKLEPDLQKRSGFLYEEAVHFGKVHSELFTATVTYTPDDSWYSLLKDTIGRMQSQTLWQAVSPEMEEGSSGSFSDFSPQASPLPTHQSFDSFTNATTSSPNVPRAFVKNPPANNNHLHHSPYGDYTVRGDSRGQLTNGYQHSMEENSIDSASLSSQDNVQQQQLLSSPTPSLSSIGKPRSILKRSSSVSSQQNHKHHQASPNPAPQQQQMQQSSRDRGPLQQQKQTAPPRQQQRYDAPQGRQGDQHVQQSVQHSRNQARHGQATEPAVTRGSGGGSRPTEVHEPVAMRRAAVATRIEAAPRDQHNNVGGHPPPLPSYETRYKRRGRSAQVAAVRPQAQGARHETNI